MKTVIILILCLFLCGCTAKMVWTDDVFAFSGSVVSWGKVDDLIIDANSTFISAGGSAWRPDANSVKAITEGVIGRLK